MLLGGIRVVACEVGLAGPLCTRLLADLGADVAKIEQPGRGDVTREWDTIADGLSSGFVWMNRGKQSVELDVRDPDRRADLEALVRGADVFLQNFTPGWAAGVGLDEPSVRRLRPDVVYVDISGYGAAGPYAQRNAYDLVMQGETGLMSIAGTPEQPARVGLSVCDLATGSYAAVAALAALVRRAETGEGSHVEVSLFDTMLDWLGYFAHMWWHRGELPERTGLHHPLFCPYGPYRAGDEKLVSLAVLSPEHWETLSRDVLGRPELAEDPRFATNEARVAARAELEPLLEAALADAPAAAWVERLVGAGIPCGLVRNVGEVLEHPQLAASELVAEVDSPAGRIPTIGVPFRVDGRRPEPGAVPALGADTDEILEQ
jgi:crotonobetainyl-CoA:carnitine CoA-transferase CaiB-like acyl-CoA transferase